MTVGTVLLSFGVAGIGYAIYQLATRPGVPKMPSMAKLRATPGLAPSFSGGSVCLSGRF